MIQSCQFLLQSLLCLDIDSNHQWGRIFLSYRIATSVLTLLRRDMLRLVVEQCAITPAMASIWGAFLLP